MEWEKDSGAVEAFDRLMKETENPLSDFMSVLHKTELLGQGNVSLLLRIVGRAVINYNNFRESMDEFDAIQATKAEMMEDPLLHHLVEKSTGSAISGLI